MNDRQKLFTEFYVDTFKKQESAIRAGYSKKTAYAIANKLLKKAEIIKYKEELIAERLGTGKDELHYRMLKRLNAISFADIGDDVQIVTKYKKVDEIDEAGELTGKKIDVPYQEMVVKDTNKSENTLAIASIKQNEKGVIEVKYHDPLKAMDMLGRHIGFIEDKMPVDENTARTREEILQRIKELQEKNRKK